MDEKITIDKATLKAIASDTRLDIIKQLDRKKQTLSDLSKVLKLSGPTIKEHLEVLASAGLVKKEESPRKWKYYSLTFKGKQLLRPNETKLFLALLISIFVGLGILLLLGLFGTMGSARSSMSQADSASEMTYGVMIAGENAVVNENIPEISAQNTSAKITTESTIDSTVQSTDDLEQTAKANTTKETTKPLFQTNYLIITTIIVVIFVIFCMYINEKQKRR